MAKFDQPQLQRVVRCPRCDTIALVRYDEGWCPAHGTFDVPPAEAEITAAPGAAVQDAPEPAEPADPPTRSRDPAEAMDHDPEPEPEPPAEAPEPLIKPPALTGWKRWRWTRDNRQAIAADVERLGKKQAALKWGLSLQAIAPIMTAARKHGLTFKPEPEPGRKHRRPVPRQAQKSGDPPADPGAPVYQLPPLPPWRDDWPAPTQCAWLTSLRFLAGERKKRGGKP